MEALVHWFSQNLSQYISPEGAVFIISMIPLLELRGGLLAASLLKIFLFRLFCYLSDRFSRF